MRRSVRPVPSSFPFSRLLLLAHLLLCSIPGILSSKLITLGSIKIFTIHEWIAKKPTVYFYCQGENKIILPDVKERDFLYTFNGQESWQPLMELPDKKCRRCGLYEHNIFKPDEAFDEWELCLSNFVDGKYVHFKEGEFNATFICAQCIASDGVGDTPNSKKEASEKRGKIFVIVAICTLASLVMAASIVASYKYWQKRKKEQDQVRFLKLFEEGDDIEDELGL